MKKNTTFVKQERTTYNLRFKEKRNRKYFLFQSDDFNGFYYVFYKFKF